MQIFDLKDIPFNLELSVSCGQAFRWKKIGEFWYAPVNGKVCKVKQEKNRLCYDGFSESELIQYFALDADLDKILESIDVDPLIHSAVNDCRGLRIMRQPRWECLISYICATCANIPGITMRIENLSEKYGSHQRYDDMDFYTFPDAEIIAGEDVSEVHQCKVGFRDAYICGAADFASRNKSWADEISAMDYESAKAKLTELKGVGPKVADCVLLFAFEKYEAVPVDVWIERILRTKYFKTEKKLSYNKAGSYAREHFGKYAGYAQEYLYAERELIAGKSK